MVKGGLHLFAYGSLMTEPEFADLIACRRVATLWGFRRVFHKISRVRGCAPSESAFPQLATPKEFRTKDRRLSLVLGLERAEGEGVVGLLQSYGADDAQDVLKRLDVREGFSPQRPEVENAYVRRPCLVTLGGGEELQATTYFTNPDHPMVAGEIAPSEAATVLLAATPLALEPGGGKSRGLGYLEDARRALRQMGHFDQNLETLVRCVYKCGGGSVTCLTPAAPGSGDNLDEKERNDGT